jgi:antitoxin CptB
MDGTREIRLKRLRIRSWRRGTREMDLILGRFADTAMASLTAAELDLYEAFLEENDHDLYAWVSGSAGVPPHHAAILARIVAARAE